MKFGFNVDKPKPLAVPKLTVAQATALGGFVIADIKDRVTRLHRNVNDTAFKPYAPGRVYIPVTGKGRTKTSLGGAPVITPATLRKMKKSGVKVNGPKAAKTGVYRTKRSISFPSRSAYKKAMGKSGLRDDEESGAMLGALTVVAAKPTEIVIGFTRDSEQKKAAANQKIDPWFGVSPSCANRTEKYASELLKKG